MNKPIAQLALYLTPGIGAVTARNLIAYCGGAEFVFSASRGELLSVPGVGEAIVHQLHTGDALHRAEQEYRKLSEQGVRMISYLDPGYPERLRHYPDSPVLLFERGKAILNAPRTLAIVGTRKPSPRGLILVEKLVRDLSPYQPIIISGLAYGIDAAAHRAAIENNLPTLAVLAHGFDYLYPAAHKELASRIQTSGGALLTEYPGPVKPDRERFPMRNRIVAGLCDALIVVETGRRGGSMITANIANDYSKHVFAIPGRVGDLTSAGCNHLIKAHRADLLESAEDLLYHLQWDLPDSTQNQQVELFDQTSPEEQQVLAILHQFEKADADTLCRRSGKPPGDLAGILLELECKGLIRSAPGQRYVLVK